MSLEQIRRKERDSHRQIYSRNALYKEGSWLSKPVKTILDLFPCFKAHNELRVLDLGCGVGRNCIAIAQHFRRIPCVIDCVDILDLAIETLNENAEEYGVSQNIWGIIRSIEDFSIEEKHYDWIIGVSALEHVESKDVFTRKLWEIRNGIRENGIVSLIVNSNVREFEKTSGNPIPAQFEVNFSTLELQDLLQLTFKDFTIIKSTVKKQHYDVPRGADFSELHTDVVTFVARK